MSLHPDRLKITSKCTLIRPKQQKAQFINNPIKKRQFGIQTQSREELTTSVSTKTLYKERYQQCEERMGQQNQYLRQYVIELNHKVSSYELQVNSLQNSNVTLKKEKQELQTHLFKYQHQQFIKNKQLQSIKEQLRNQNASIINQYSLKIQSLQQIIQVKEKYIENLKNNIFNNQQEFDHQPHLNAFIKDQINKSSSTYSNICPKYNDYQKKRTGSLFHGLSIKQPSCDIQSQPQLSPKQAARMEVLLEEYNQLKNNILDGQFDRGSILRLMTLIQYLRQTLKRKNIQITELKQTKILGLQSKYNIIETVDNYEKALFQTKQQNQSLQCQIRILRDQRNQSIQQPLQMSLLRQKHEFKHNSRSHKSINKYSLKKSINHFEMSAQRQDYSKSRRHQQNIIRSQLSLSKTQHLHYRETAKKQLNQKLNQSNTILNDVKNLKSSGFLTDRKNSTSILHSGSEKYNYVYSKCQLSQYLKKKLSLVLYMTLVVKITQLAEKCLKKGIYKVISAKDIIVMTCLTKCPESLKIKCELKPSGQLALKQQTPVQIPEQNNDLSVMWSMGLIFKMIFESIQIDSQQEKDLFYNIVRPQFEVILKNILVEDPKQRMNMDSFKNMLAKLS